MLSTETNSADTSTEYSFRQAKAEHYLERAAELVKMARFEPALETLQTLFGIDGTHRDALVLHKEILAELRSLTNNHLGERTADHRTRRNEIVLMIDQDEQVLTSLAAELRRYGFRVVGAANFAEATDVLTQFKPDLILSEVNFEDGPIGYDIYLWIRNSAALATIPFFFLATRVTREMVIAGKRMGVDELIMKPLDPEVVIASIRKCFAQRRPIRH